MRKKPLKSTSYSKLIVILLVPFILLIIVAGAIVSQALLASISRYPAATPTPHPTVSKPLPTPIFIMAPTTATVLPTMLLSTTVPQLPTDLPVAIPTCLSLSEVKSSGSVIAQPPAATPQPRSSYSYIYTDEFEGNVDIYQSKADGSDKKRLTDAPGADTRPNIVGNQIFFTSERDGNTNIYVMDREGKNQRPLTTSPASDRYEAISPDGSQIAFVTNRDGNEDIYIMDSDGTNQKPLTTSSSLDTRPDWSPDGSQILFSSDRDHEGRRILYIMNADGSSQRPLVADLPGGTDVSDWSSDGTLIVFLMFYRDVWDIFRINSDGTHLCQLTNDPEAEASPFWNLEGNIAYMRDDGNGTTAQEMSADGSNVLIAFTLSEQPEQKTPLPASSSTR